MALDVGNGKGFCSGEGEEQRKTESLGAIRIEGNPPAIWECRTKATNPPTTTAHSDQIGLVDTLCGRLLNSSGDPSQTLTLVHTSGNYPAATRGVQLTPRGGETATVDIYSSHPDTKKAEIKKRNVL